MLGVSIKLSSPTSAEATSGDLLRQRVGQSGSFPNRVTTVTLGEGCAGHSGKGWGRQSRECDHLSRPRGVGGLPPAPERRTRNLLDTALDQLPERSRRPRRTIAAAHVTGEARIGCPGSCPPRCGAILDAPDVPLVGRLGEADVAWRWRDRVRCRKRVWAGFVLIRRACRAAPSAARLWAKRSSARG
jgi:hypothetical protein